MALQPDRNALYEEGLSFRGEWPLDGVVKRLQMVIAMSPGKYTYSRSIGEAIEVALSWQFDWFKFEH